MDDARQGDDHHGDDRHQDNGEVVVEVGQAVPYRDSHNNNHRHTSKGHTMSLPATQAMRAEQPQPMSFFFSFILSFIVNIVNTYLTAKSIYGLTIKCEYQQ